MLKVPLTAIPGSNLCPVNAFLNMTKLVPASDDDPAFGLSDCYKAYLTFDFGEKLSVGRDMALRILDTETNDFK